MNFPKPVPGMVIRYSYLWANESEAGREEGSKDRPCAIIFTTLDLQGAIRTQILPVTHSPPSNMGDGVEIPSAVKRHLGLDTERSWVLLSEVNVFAWPGYDLRPVGKLGSPVYGILPPAFYRYIRSRFLARQNFKVIDRT